LADTRLRKRRVKNGRDDWSALIPVPKGPDGKRRQHRFTFVGNKKEAEKALAAELVRIGEGSFIPPTRTTPPGGTAQPSPRNVRSAAGANRAGGHAGTRDPRALLEELADLGREPARQPAQNRCPLVRVEARHDRRRARGVHLPERDLRGLHR